MTEINRYLDSILYDFKQYISSGVKLCDLKKVHFDAGRVPDYNDIHVQQLYLLRYCYAYAFEYKRMYQILKETVSLCSPLTVTSIGCGNMVDYWALTHLVGKGFRICYRGIDCIDWSYKFPERTLNEVEFFHQDAVQYFNSVPQMSSDIYIFPKSISELSTTTVGEICDIIYKKEFCKDSVYFLFSLRTDDKSLAIDMEKTKMFYDAMINCGFLTDDSYNDTISIDDVYKNTRICGPDDAFKNRNIYCLDREFMHPQKIVNFLSTLHTNCMNYDSDCCKNTCKLRLDRLPVLKCTRMKWQLFRFWR